MKLKIGDVVETAKYYYLITGEDDNFIYARRVSRSVILREEAPLFTKRNIEEEMRSDGVKAIIDMNEVTRRYIEMT